MIHSGDGAYWRDLSGVFGGGEVRQIERMRFDGDIQQPWPNSSNTVAVEFAMMTGGIGGRKRL